MHCRGKMKHSGNFFWFLLLLIFEIFRFSSFRFLWCILRAGLVHIPPSRRWEENPRPRNPRFFNFLFLCGSWGLRELVQFWNRGWTRKENTFTRITIPDVHGNFSSFLHKSSCSFFCDLLSGLFWWMNILLNWIHQILIEWIIFLI